MGYEEEKQRQLDLRYLRMARIWEIGRAHV